MSVAKPVIVDLDGTLTHSDTLLENVLLLLKGNPLMILLLPFWLLKGKAVLKNRIAERVALDVSLLPYNGDVLAYLRQARSEGHACYLATGAPAKTANAVSDYLQLFDGIFSTTDSTNLTGSRKAQLLNERFGEGNYIYLGNHAVDLKIWHHAGEAVVVSNSHLLLQQAQRLCGNARQLAPPKATLKTWLKAIRVHQWVKNALLLVPLLTSHQWQDPQLLLLAVIGFFCFSLAASSVYVLNDLLDLAADRQHPSKRKRPFASGVISLHAGVALLPLLLLLVGLLALLLPAGFVWALALYYLLTLLYSFKLKRIVMLDTIVLAGLYTMRIVAGTLLLGVDFSFWLLAFSMFIFLSLALVKRYTELLLLKDSERMKTAGRGYHAEDAGMLSGLGAASGYIAVLVFALYVNSPDVLELYARPQVLWLACPVLLYWISRVWLVAHRGQMDDDPIVFAVKDLQSLFTGLCVLAIFGAAL